MLSQAEKTLAKAPVWKLPDAQRLINTHTVVECAAVRRRGKHPSSCPTARLQGGEGGEGGPDVRRRTSRRQQLHLHSSCTDASRSCRRIESRGEAIVGDAVFSGVFGVTRRVLRCLGWSTTIERGQNIKPPGILNHGPVLLLLCSNEEELWLEPCAPVVFLWSVSDSLQSTCVAQKFFPILVFPPFYHVTLTLVFLMTWPILFSSVFHCLRG